MKYYFLPRSKICYNGVEFQGLRSLQERDPKNKRKKQKTKGIRLWVAKSQFLGFPNYSTFLLDFLSSPPSWDAVFDSSNSNNCTHDTDQSWKRNQNHEFRNAYFKWLRLPLKYFNERDDKCIREWHECRISVVDSCRPHYGTYNNERPRFCACATHECI